MHGQTITIGNSESFDIRINNVPRTIKAVGRKVGNRYVHLFKSNLETILACGNKSLSTQYTYNVTFDEKAIKDKSLKPSVRQFDSYDEFPDPTYVINGYYAWAIDTDTIYRCTQVGQYDFAWVEESTYQNPIWRNNNLYEYEYGVLKGVITFDSQRVHDYKVCFIEDIQDIDLTSVLQLQDMYRSLLLTGLSYRLAIRYKLSEWVNVFKEDFEEQKDLIKRVNNSNRPIVWSHLGESYLDDYYNGLNGNGW